MSIIAQHVIHLAAMPLEDNWRAGQPQPLLYIMYFVYTKRGRSN